MNIVYASVNQSYEPGMDATQLAENAHRAWPLSLTKSRSMEYLVAVFEGNALMAWPILDAYATEEVYVTNGGERPRIGFALGAPAPIRPEWHGIPELRRGVAFSDR